jgi:GT2 family glycosyltransferase
VSLPPDLVLIGRNEGDRLETALQAAVAARDAGEAGRLVYVDSGSQDESVAAAEAAGAAVVALTPDRAFSAARGRNAGFARLDAQPGGAAPVVQFLDGDCELVPGWLPAGRAALEADPGLALVTGWAAEVAPDASLYNALMHVEWRRPAGPILACSGNMMLRAEALRAAGGFREDVIAAEDDELCCRLRAAGGRLERLPVEMARHDARMTRFGQWWRRATRTGHGFEQVNALHPDHFRRERARMWLYGLGLPLLAVALAVLAGPLWVLPVIGLYALSYLRSARSLVRADGVAPAQARRLAALLVLSKFPNVLGAMRYRLRRWRKRDITLIEYK